MCENFTGKKSNANDGQGYCRSWFEVYYNL